MDVPRALPPFCFHALLLFWHTVHMDFILLHITNIFVFDVAYVWMCFGCGRNMFYFDFAPNKVHKDRTVTFIKGSHWSFGCIVCSMSWWQSISVPAHKAHIHFKNTLLREDILFLYLRRQGTNWTVEPNNHHHLCVYSAQFLSFLKFEHPFERTHDSIKPNPQATFKSINKTPRKCQRELGTSCTC